MGPLARLVAQTSAVAIIAAFMPLSVDLGHDGVSFGSSSAQAAGNGGGNGGGNAKSGSSDGSGVDGGEDGSSTEGKSVTVDDYEILVARYCRCEDNSPVDCDTGTCTAGGGNRRTYVRVRIGTNFNTIFDYPGIPPVVALEREARLRAR